MVFENIKKSLDKVSEILELSEEEKNILLSCKSLQRAELKTSFGVFDAWRIIHNNSLGVGKGGIRFHPNVSEDEVKSLSFWMSLKNSLSGLPYGGAKGGVKINPKEFNREQLEELSRVYIRAFHEFIGEDKDVPAPDISTNSETMGWMLDEFEKIKRKHEPGFITGKPLELGGISLRYDSTSRGGVIILKEFLKKIGRKYITIAVQGFGNVGANVALMLYNEGFNVVAVSDSQGGIFNQGGLNIKEVMDAKEKGSVCDYEYGEKISNDELLELDVDILILAALENQITLENVKKIKTKHILELANGPISADADEVLFKNDVIVVPDILANSGGVIVSYFEWCQNKTGNILDEDYLKEKLNKIMIESFEKVYNLSAEKNISMRQAAYVIAIKRILDAERARGNL